MLLRATLREGLIFTKYQISEQTILLVLVFISFLWTVRILQMSYMCCNPFPI